MTPSCFGNLLSLDILWQSEPDLVVNSVQEACSTEEQGIVQYAGLSYRIPAHLCGESCVSGGENTKAPVEDINGLG